MSRYTILQLDGTPLRQMRCTCDDNVRAALALICLAEARYHAVATIHASGPEHAFVRGQNDHPEHGGLGWVRSAAVEQWADRGYSVSVGDALVEWPEGERIQMHVYLVQPAGFTELAYPGTREAVEAILQTSEQRAVERGHGVQP